MNNHTHKFCTICGVEHLGIYSHVKCADCYFKNSDYWKKQTRKEKIASVLIYTASAIIAGICLFLLFQFLFRS